MDANQNKIKSSGLMGSYLLAIGTFGISAGLFYLAYVGMETGTAIKIKSHSSSVPHQRGQMEYDGVYSKDKDSRLFWFDEIFFVGAAIAFATGGFHILRTEYKERRQEKFLSAHHLR